MHAFEHTINVTARRVQGKADQIEIPGVDRGHDGAVVSVVPGAEHLLGVHGCPQAAGERASEPF